MENKKEEKKSTLKIEDLEKVELPKLDVTLFAGSKVKIENVEIMEGNWGHYLKLSTEPLADLGEDKLRATKILGISQDKEGKYGWGDETKLGKYLSKKGVVKPIELKGVEVTTTIELDKDNNERLTFV